MMTNVFKAKDGKVYYILDIRDLGTEYKTEDLYIKLFMEGILDCDENYTLEEQLLTTELPFDCIMIKKFYRQTKADVEAMLERIRIPFCEYDPSKFEETPVLTPWEEPCLLQGDPFEGN